MFDSLENNVRYVPCSKLISSDFFYDDFEVIYIYISTTQFVIGATFFHIN